MVETGRDRSAKQENRNGAGKASFFLFSRFSLRPVSSTEQVPLSADRRFGSHPTRSGAIRIGGQKWGSGTETPRSPTCLALAALAVGTQRACSIRRSGHGCSRAVLRSSLSQRERAGVRENGAGKPLAPRWMGSLPPHPDPCMLFSAFLVWREPNKEGGAARPPAGGRAAARARTSGPGVEATRRVGELVPPVPRRSTPGPLIGRRPQVASSHLQG